MEPGASDGVRGMSPPQRDRRHLIASEGIVAFDPSETHFNSDVRHRTSSKMKPLRSHPPPNVHRLKRAPPTRCTPGPEFPMEIAIICLTLALRALSGLAMWDFLLLGGSGSSQPRTHNPCSFAQSDGRMDFQHQQHVFQEKQRNKRRFCFIDGQRDTMFNTK